MLNVKVGDEVIVCDGGGTRSKSYTATVTEVRRKLFTIRGSVSWLDGDYRLDTGYLNNGSHAGWGPPRVITMEQQEMAERRSNALAILRQCHISLDHRNGLTLEQIEALAEVARTFIADTSQEG